MTPNWLTAPIAAAIAAVLLVTSIGLGFKLWLTTRDLDSATARVEKVERDNGTLRANNATLEAGFAGIGVTLDKMHSDAVARERARVAADVRIDASLEQSLGALSRAKPGPDKCASASDLIREFSK